jgi:GTP 3',8-cyclase
MPEEGIKLLSHDDILTYDEIAGFTRAAVLRGVKKVRLTGGEPLVRKGIAALVSMISEIEGIEDLSMTPMEFCLANMLPNLKKPDCTG